MQGKVKPIYPEVVVDRILRGMVNPNAAHLPGKGERREGPPPGLGTGRDDVDPRPGRRQGGQAGQSGS